MTPTLGWIAWELRGIVSMPPPIFSTPLAAPFPVMLAFNRAT